MTVEQIIRGAAERFKKSNSRTPRLDAEVLLVHILGKPREYILAHSNHELKNSQAASYRSLVARRAKGEPIAYITGHKEFYGLDFLVTKDTLIPRPETELIVDEALILLNKVLSDKTTVIDVGTGSGNIIISLAKALNHGFETIEHELMAIDDSKKALDIAKQNAKKHGLEECITFLSGCFLDPLIENYKKLPARRNFDTGEKIEDPNMLILANLPYLSEKIYKNSPMPVKNFEPKESLLSGDDGLSHYRKLFNQIKVLNVPCYALCEISPEQKKAFRTEALLRFPESTISFFKDLSGKWRIAECLLKPATRRNGSETKK